MPIDQLKAQNFANHEIKRHLTPGSNRYTYDDWQITLYFLISPHSNV